LKKFANLVNRSISGSPAAFGNEAPSDVVVGRADCLPKYVGDLVYL
jgi:hypothetical protein